MKSPIRNTLLLGVLLGLAIGLGGYTFIYSKGYSYLTNNPAACANTRHASAVRCLAEVQPPLGRYMQFRSTSASSEALRPAIIRRISQKPHRRPETERSAPVAPTER